MLSFQYFSIMIILCFLFVSSLFLNGATDAANTVTGAIASRIMKPPAALLLAALFEAAGVIISQLVHPAVGELVSSLVDFSPSDVNGGTVCAVCLATVAIWAAAAWIAGLPTSESHGLMASMCGCGAALGYKIDAVGCLVVLAGLALSVFLGSALSLLSVRLMSCMRKKSGAQKIVCILFLLASAFLHGAQDGQKFLALLFSTCNVPVLPAIVVCAAVMGAGTMCGGGRIVKKMGTDLTHTDLYTSCAADAGSSAALLLLSAAGVPVSTTHVRMSALAAASYGDKKPLDKKILADLIIAWVTTFPFCFILAFVLIKVLASLGLC